jgi:hypothetical protein
LYDALYNSNISKKFHVVLIIDLESMCVCLPPEMFLIAYHRNFILSNKLKQWRKIFAIIINLPFTEIPANKSKLYSYPRNLNHTAASVTNIEEIIE